MDDTDVRYLQPTKPSIHFPALRTPRFLNTATSSQTTSTVLPKLKWKLGAATSRPLRSLLRLQKHRYRMSRGRRFAIRPACRFRARTRRLKKPQMPWAPQYPSHRRPRHLKSVSRNPRIESISGSARQSRKWNRPLLRQTKAKKCETNGLEIELPPNLPERDRRLLVAACPGPASAGSARGR